MTVAHDHFSQDLVCIVQSHGAEEGAVGKVRQFSESVKSLRDPGGAPNTDRGWLLVSLLPPLHSLSGQAPFQTPEKTQSPCC